MTTLTLHLRTTSLRLADGELTPLENQHTILSEEGEEISINWGEQRVRMGAVETTFELIGALVVIGGVTVKVASALLTKWLWSKIEAAQKAGAVSPPTLEAEIRIDGNTTVKINTESEAQLHRSIEAVLASRERDG